LVKYLSHTHIGRNVATSRWDPELLRETT